jgi:hypothetical protein
MLLRLVLLLALLIFELNPAFAKRVALVIGNSSYQNTTVLANPVNDAKLMDKALRDAGFDVTLVLDADKDTMGRALLEFGRTLRKGVDASMFYYAGHGVQVGGENYLVPINATLESEDEVDLQTYPVNAFLRTMESAKSPVNIVVLDACRNNPFSRGFRGTNGGLAPVNAPRGSYIAYATAPGTVAADGEGGNSPYTFALASVLAIPGLKLEDVFKKTREKVLASTDEKQVPWETSSMTGDFIFKAAPPEGRVTTPIYSIDADFDFARSLNTVTAWDLFLKRFGNTKDMRIGVAIEERAKLLPVGGKDDYSDFSDQVFDFSIGGQDGLKLVAFGFSYDGSRLFARDAKKSVNRLIENRYVFEVVENDLNKRLAQWCVLDLSKKWNMLPKDRPEVALCDDQPFEIRGSYKFTPRSEKKLTAKSGQ